MYCGLIVLAAALVLIPGVPLGLLTNAVQTLAGVLLPSATVFLLLLCNDKDVLGPWVNGRFFNVLSAIIVAVLVLLSIILTAAVVFPDMSGETISNILIGGSVIGLIIAIVVNVLHAREEMEKGQLPHHKARKWTCITCIPGACRLWTSCPRWCCHSVTSCGWPCCAAIWWWPWAW
jgi:hypothetical protein